MFIRWKNRTGKDWRAWHGRVDRTRRAYLVKSVRVDGKPRQKVVASLASVREFSLDCPWTSGEEHDRRNRAARVSFWAQVETRVSQIELTEQDLQVVLASLARIVPQLTGEERALYEADEARRRREAVAMLQMLGRG